MRIKLNKVPMDGGELNKLIQDIYLTAKKNYTNGVESSFTGILEMIASESNILLAVQRVKENIGSLRIRPDEIDEHLTRGQSGTLEVIREKLYNYHPAQPREMWIPETGRTEKRRCLVPAMTDRIIQECVRNILEPLTEAQFSEHSYGFRPMRWAGMAVAELRYASDNKGCDWALQGRIRDLPHRAGHAVMINSLWNLGIRDKRVLSIVRQMLAAGVMEECSGGSGRMAAGAFPAVSETWARAGMSEWLTNVYLHRFDNMFRGCHYVRFEDQWAVMTDRRQEAEELFQRARGFLRDALKLELCEEETGIVNICSETLRFAGVEIRAGKKNGERVIRVLPDKERFQREIKELNRMILSVGKAHAADREKLLLDITRVNGAVMGLINYYSMCDQTDRSAARYAWALRYSSYRALKEYGGRWVRADKTANLTGLHHGRKVYIPAVRYEDMYVGITDIGFARQHQLQRKNSGETPYTPEGRALFYRRRREKGLRALTDEVGLAAGILPVGVRNDSLYNFEYLLNGPDAYKRDRARCRICGRYVEPEDARMIHIDKKLPANRVNKTENLITVHRHCHNLIPMGSRPKLADTAEQ